MKIGFICEYLNLRGMAVATYDYAHFNETILGNESVIFYDNNCPNLKLSNKFTDRFKQNTIPYSCYIELDPLITQHKIDFIYRLSFGHDESHLIINKSCPWGIHAVFANNANYGDKYVYISEWLRDFCNPTLDFVPHMVNLPNINETLHTELNLNKNDFIFGCYGGDNSFDLKIVTRAIRVALSIRSDLTFIFLNINRFTNHPRCKFYKGTDDVNIKTKFINTCDAMIHARTRGETFGLAIAEFSSRNKRIVAWKRPFEKAHLKILGDKGILFEKEQDLVDIFLNIQKDPYNDYDCYSKEYSPEKVMEKFSKVFLGK